MMNCKRSGKGLFLGLLFLVLAGCGSGEAQTVPEWTEEVQTVLIETEPIVTAARVVVVHICGEVMVPGVYELPEGSRVQDAVDAAGGMTGMAASAYLNLARLLVDGEQIVVPDEAMAVTAVDVPVLETASGKVNVNTADKGQLEELPGIGVTKAQAIVSYREDKGGFSSIEEIMEVPGIGPSVFQQLKDLICV